MRFVRCLLLLLACCVLWVPAAQAADPAAAESLFRKGKELMQENKLEEACKA